MNYLKNIFLLPFSALFLFSQMGKAKADQIAIFYALEKDYEKLAAGGKDIKPPIKVGSRSIQRFVIGPHQIVAVKMGSGAVETAISAQALLARYRCDWAISLGPVGVISDSLTVGQWVRVDQAVAYDRGSVTEEGFVLKSQNEDRKAEDKVANLPKPWMDLRAIVAASGEKFYSSDAGRLELHTLTKADAVEMNLAGLLPVCEDYHIRIINWRIISDRADKNASVDFRKFVESYQGDGGGIVADWIATLPISPERPEAYENLKNLLQK